jgi:PTH1 family peptidyl-tRNA hydrolase
MYLIVGLGNPEPEYSNTRHNMGFDVVNVLADKYKIAVCSKKHSGLVGTGEIAGKKVVLLKPQTYVNLSGESILKCMHFYKIDINNVIIICDDIDLKTSKIRIRENGSAGTHNGLKSVVHELQTEKFIRVKVGVDKPEENYELINYLIRPMKKEETEEVQDGIKKAAEAVVHIIEKGASSAMNTFNPS